ncbi:MAG: hypothetical protein HYZ18_04220 [Pseudogulbenkiania sp.]|nr:hypothetical protein [Pseudogulbenkiania sp.]
MEIALDVGEHHATVSCSTDLVNRNLAIAVVAFDGPTPCFSQADRAIYRTLKEAALDAIAQQIGTYPLVVEPILPYWPERRPATAKSTAGTT